MDKQLLFLCFRILSLLFHPLLGFFLSQGLLLLLLYLVLPILDFGCCNCSSPTDAEPVGMGRSLTPVAACKEDFSKMKLTSFSKLIEKTSGSIKNVRLCSEPDHKPGNSGMAPDAVYASSYFNFSFFM